MRLRSVIAPNMREGMRRIREQFGDDAIIVSTEETETGVLIMAATERPEATAAEPAPIEEPEHPAAPPPHGETTPASPPAAGTVPQCLDFHGLPRLVAADLAMIASITGTTSEVDSLAAALDESLGFSPLDPATTDHPLMLVGDAGAGKTVVMAKLATEAKLAGREVAAITADTARRGGTEQLAAFMGAIGVDLWPLDRVEDLARAISMARPGSLVLIDTPALNPLDCSGFALRKQLMGSIEPVLVLPAGLQPDDAAEAAAAAKTAVGVRRLIATRLDTSRRYGAVIAAARVGRVSLAGFCDSRRIAEPIQRAGPHVLASRMFNQLAIRTGP